MGEATPQSSALTEGEFVPESPALSPIELKQELPKYLPALQVRRLPPQPALPRRFQPAVAESGSRGQGGGCRARVGKATVKGLAPGLPHVRGRGPATKPMGGHVWKEGRQAGEWLAWWSLLLRPPELHGVLGRGGRPHVLPSWDAAGGLGEE